MTLRFRYQQNRVNRPVVPLGGRWVRPCPVIPVALLGPTGTWATDALLDTGADDTIFPEAVARLIGIDLTNTPIGSAMGAGATNVPLRYSQVVLRITDGREFREWTAWLGFTSAPLTYPVLGFAGCLQFCTATFHGDREEVELAVNSLYPGT